MSLPLNPVQPIDDETRRLARRRAAALVLQQAGARPAAPSIDNGPSAASAVDQNRQARRAEAAAVLRSAGATPSINPLPGAETLTAPPGQPVVSKGDPLDAVRRLFAEYEAGPQDATASAVFSAQARRLLGSPDKQTPEQARYADLLSEPPTAERNAAFEAGTAARLRPDTSFIGARPDAPVVAADATDTRLGQDPFARNTTTASDDDTLRREVERLRLVSQTEADPSRRAQAFAAFQSAETALAEREAGLSGMAAETGRQFVRGVAEIGPGLTDAAAAFQEFTGGGVANPGIGRIRALALREAAGVQRDVLNDVTGIDPVLSRGTAAQVAQGLGSSVPFLAASVASGGTALAPAALGALQGAGSEYRQADDARRAGTAETDDVFFATLLGGVVGAGEGIPLGRAFERANAATGGALARTARQIVADFGEEAAQGWISNQLNDASARFTYEPGRAFDLHLEEALIEGLSGGLSAGAFGVLTARSQGTDSNPTTQIDAAAPPSSVVAPRAEPVPQAPVDLAAADTDAPAPAVERVVPAAVAPAELSPEVASRVARIEAALPLVPEAQRPILEAELARLTNGSPAATASSAPTDNPAAEGMVERDGSDRPLDVPPAEGVGSGAGLAAEDARSLSERSTLASVLPEAGTPEGRSPIDPALDPAPGDGRPAPADAPVAPAAPAAPAPGEPRTVPRDNYARPLGELTPRLYRETSVDGLSDLLTSDTAMAGDAVYYADTPDLALGQGDNTGVLIEADGAGLSGRINTSKPGWQPLYESGSAEYVARGNSQRQYRDAVQRVTIRPEAQTGSRKSSVARLTGPNGFFAREGWTRTDNADGSVTYERPDTAETGAAAAQTPAVEASPMPSVPERPAGQNVTAYLGENAVALREAAAAEVESYADLDWEGDGYAAEAEAMRRASESQNPAVLIDAWTAAKAREDGQGGGADAAIATHLPTMSRDQLAETGLSGTDAGRAGRAYFRTGQSVGGVAYLNAEEAAQRVSDESGVPVDAEAVLDFVRRYPGGPSEYRARLRDTRRAIEGQFKNVTGEPLTERRAARYTAALNAETSGPVPVEAKPDGYGSQNAGVDRAGYEAAKAALRASVGDVFSNPLPSPEVLRAWAQIAAFHIEAGAREFAAFAGRMIEDAGEAVRPYLRALYDEAQQAVSAAAPVSEPTAQPSVDDILASVEGAPAAAEPSVEDLLAQYAPENAAPEPVAEEPTVALNKSAITEARALLNLSDLAPESARRWNDVLRQAEDTGQASQAGDIALAVLANPRAVSDVEHAALVLGAAQKQTEYRQLLSEAEAIESDGGDATYVTERARAVLATLDRITEASDRSGREAARALSIRRLRLNAETYEIASVLRQARADKGSSLTPAERETLSDLVGQVERADARVRELEAEVERLRATRSRTAAQDRVSREGRKEVRDAARQKNARDRAVILDELRSLGLRVSDVTGLTIDGSVLVGRLALTFAKDGALTLQEVVDRVRGVLPDVSEEDVVEAIARPKRIVPEKTEAELERARVERSRAQKAVRAAQRALAPRNRYAWIGEILGAPRALMATGDMSAVLRQGAILLPLTAVRNPKGLGRAFTKATGAFFRSYTAEQADLMIRSDPRQFTRDAAGLYLAPIGDAAGVANVGAREEQFMSRFIERVPGLGQLMQASERHYGTFLNLLRVAAFDSFADARPDATAEDLRVWADYVNKASGRGDLGQFSQAATALSGVFFAPRFMVSRFQAPAAVLQPSISRAVRTEIALSLSSFVGVGLLALTLARLALDDDEAEIGTSPRSPDFGKLVVGDTRIDVWASEQQVARLLARGVLVGTDHYGLTDAPRGARETTPWDLATTFLKYKLAPTVTIPQELVTGKNAVGEDVTPGETLGRALLPLGVTETYNTYDEHGANAAAAVYLGNFFGVGVSVYDKK